MCPSCGTAGQPLLGRVCANTPSNPDRSRRSTEHSSTSWFLRLNQHTYQGPTPTTHSGGPRMCNWSEDICLVLTSVMQDQQLSSQNRQKCESVRVALPILVLYLPDVPQYHTGSDLNTRSAIYDILISRCVSFTRHVASGESVSNAITPSICIKHSHLTRGNTPYADNAIWVWHT